MSRTLYAKGKEKARENPAMATKKKYGTRWLCTTALLMAMNIVMSMSVFSVPVPGGTSI